MLVPAYKDGVALTDPARTDPPWLSHDFKRPVPVVPDLCGPRQFHAVLAPGLPRRLAQWLVLSQEVGRLVAGVLVKPFALRAMLEEIRRVIRAPDART